MARVWVKPFTRADGVKVKGYWRGGVGNKTPNSKTDLDSRIDSLKPGQEMRLGGNKKVWTTVERSGTGRELRFVRHTPKGSTVFKKKMI